MKTDLVNEMGMRYLKIPYYSENEKNENTAAVLQEYEYNILESNKISGLACVSKRVVNEKTYLLIPISSYISLEEKLQKDSLNVDLFREFFKQLLAVYENIQLYLLDGNSICLDPSYIYFDEMEKHFIFIPVVDKDISILEKFERLFTFFVDICPLEEKELLGFIFENFNVLAEDSFETVSFIQYLIHYEFHIKLKNETADINTILENRQQEEEFEEKDFEKTKNITIFIICGVLLVLAFSLTYLMEYEFKYNVISIAASVLATGVMAFQVFRMTKHLPKNQKV